MFADTKVFSAFAVDDLAQARKFYGETLGVRVSERQHGLLTLHLAGDRDTRMYAKPDHTHPRGAAGAVARAAHESGAEPGSVVITLPSGAALLGWLPRLAR